jgi:hypothetical protein
MAVMVGSTDVLGFDSPQTAQKLMGVARKYEASFAFDEYGGIHDQPPDLGAFRRGHALACMWPSTLCSVGLRHSYRAPVRFDERNVETDPRLIY